MSVEELAQDFMKLMIEEDAEGYQTYWSDDIVSLEPEQDSPMARVEGREALKQKHAWWEANTEVHDPSMQGPYVFGDQFAVRYTMDVTMDGERSQMEEVGLYTVKDDKIVEERFFYGHGDYT
jgi:ketosteroid isomerase-like protein